MSNLRPFGSAIAHVKRSGDGEAHTANQIAFDDETAETGETNLQAVIDALVARIVVLEEAAEEPSEPEEL
jgi:hypothetical protein